MKKNSCNQLSLDFAKKSYGYKVCEVDADLRRRRCSLLFAVALLWTSAIVSRLVYLQFSQVERWEDWALKQHVSEVQRLSERGVVFDREHRLLAVSVPAGSVYVRPRQIKDKDAASKQLAEVLEISQDLVLQRMESSQPFVWIRRQLPRVIAEKAAALKIAGVNYVMEARRLYPFNQAGSALIGKVGIDGVGLSGIELAYQQHLQGNDEKARVNRDAIGNIIEVAGSNGFHPPSGNSLSLTIDAMLQLIVDEELEQGRLDAEAKRALAVLIDSDSGEIMAMGQAPSFNFNNSVNSTGNELNNYVVETVFEPGSILKPIVAAAALEAGVASPLEQIFCENGRFRVGRNTIKDVHGHGGMSFYDVVVRSSNIGMTKVGMRLGKDQLHSALRSFGFGERIDLGLPGESRGILRDPGSWAMVDIATHAFGQGIAVTPLQVVRAVAAIANGGKLPNLRLVNDGRDFELQRVVSESSARKVQAMMRGVVEEEYGTGRKAAITGVMVGGKTGTAQKARVDGRGYEPGAYLASFVGFADAAALGVRKLLTLVVMIDEPHGKSIYGGTLAAPVFRRIMQRSLHYLATRSELGVGQQQKPLSPARSVEFQQVALYANN